MPDTKPCPPFSLLMAVYEGDSVAYLRRALLSNTLEQSRVPAQLVVVRDGPVPAALESFLGDVPTLLLARFAEAGKAAQTPTINIVRLPRNGGLAHALNKGLAVCRYDLVARADSDDVAVPSRFAALLPMIDGSHTPVCDVIGSAIREFSGDERHPGQIRRLPEAGEALQTYARLQSPLHHPSVAFRKSVVLAAGGYPEHSGRFEDYLLWERLIMRGSRIANLPEPLVLYRVNAGAYERRGGWSMFRDELALQRQFHADGFTTTVQFLRNVMVRAVYRLLPRSIRQAGYRLLTAVHNRARPQTPTTHPSSSLSPSPSSPSTRGH